MKREIDDYLAEALEKGWQFAHEVQPRILFEDGGNLLRRIRGYQKIIEVLLPKLDLLVTLDWHMSNTALYSDYVFPAAAWYEKDDITWATTLAPFAQVITRAAEPLAEAKPDWEFHCLFVKELQKRAAERGIADDRPHAERGRYPQHFAADVPETNDADRRAGQQTAELAEGEVKRERYVLRDRDGVAARGIREANIVSR